MSGSERYHLRGVCLPEGGAARELWVADGVISTRPVEGCTQLGTGAGYLLPGLVDCHVHLSWGEGGSAATRIAEARDVLTRQGTLLVRDMGAIDDSMLARTFDEPALCGVVPCGTMILPYDEPPFRATHPGELVAAVQARIAAGARWIKVFVDWTRDYGGDLDTGFHGDDRLSYDASELSEAVACAHAAGARVAAHTFGAEGARAAVRAGVDSLEHGWGVEQALLPEMVERNVAWAPLLSIARAMRWGAQRAADASRIAWIDARLAALRTLLPLGRELGVCVVAGSDWGPGIPIAEEVTALHRAGLSTTDALGAATTAARAFLRAPGIEHGARADLLYFADDPREDLQRLLRPDAILCGGQRVTRPPPPPPAPPPV